MTAAAEDTDMRWMDRALELAAQARADGEVPVGSVVVRDGVEIGGGYNMPISSADPTAHAEIVALRQAAAAAGNYRLTGATVYVTMEPCSMCVGALVHARVDRVVFGARDPKSGALGSVIDLNAAGLHNHHLRVAGGVRAAECAALLQSFFRERRRGQEGSARPDAPAGESELPLS